MVSARPWLMLIAAMGLLAVLTFATYPGLAGFAAALAASATATPTKTPHPVTATPMVLAPALVISPMPTSTPVPSPAPTATPPAAAGLSPYLAGIVAHYGMDAGRRFVVVDPSIQRMTVWEPDQPVREFPISTGDQSRGYRTPAWYGLIGRYWGTFRAFEVNADEGWYLFEDAGSILIHGAPYKLVNGVKVYEEMDALGNYPASRGCIRLAPEDAAWLTQWQPQGVPLVILPSNWAAAATG